MRTTPPLRVMSASDLPPSRPVRSTMQIEDYSSLSDAVLDLRTGFVRAVIYIPHDYSRRVEQGNRPRIAFIEDNTDNFVTSEVFSRMQSLVQDINQSLNPFQPGQRLTVPTPRLDPLVDLQVVELYPYIEYIKYLLSGSIAMSIFIVAMIGGGITFIDDKSRGLHEGYLGDADQEIGIDSRPDFLRRD